MKQRKTTLTFAGQAGFILESADGYRMGVDLYLSNCCERYFGFKRLMPYLYDPLELELDAVVATHAHYDHFDPDSVPLLMRNGKTRLVAARDVRVEAEKLGLGAEKITYLGVGDTYADDNVTIKALPCDHGELAPDALGLLITIDGKRIYLSELCRTLFKQVLQHRHQNLRMCFFIIDCNFSTQPRVLVPPA